MLLKADFSVIVSSSEDGASADGWTPCNEVNESNSIWNVIEDKTYFTTNHAYNQIEWNTEIFQVNKNDSILERTLDDFGDMPYAFKSKNLIII